MCHWADGDRAIDCSRGTEEVVKYVEIVPEAGTFLVFPGWLPHAVQQQQEGVRVSVAANFDLPYAPDPDLPWAFQIPHGLH